MRPASTSHVGTPSTQQQGDASALPHARHLPAVSEVASNEHASSEEAHAPRKRVLGSVLMFLKSWL